MNHQETMRILNHPEYGIVLECADAELADHFDDFLVANFSEQVPQKFETEKVSFFFGKTIPASVVEFFYKQFLKQDAISWLCDWYHRQCVDEWQEEYGVYINTLDNPGWSIKIDLVRTALQDKPFQEVKFERSEHDWITARMNAKHFEAFGGPNNLHELIEIFLRWTIATEARSPT